MAFVIANELGVNLKQTSGPVIEKSGDLVAILNDLEPNDVLFIDEIHRLPMAVEEVLYSAMEDFYIDIMIGSGETSRSVHLNLPPFTLIGATTRADMLSNPLRARFGVTGHMEYYEAGDLTEIVERTAKIFEMDITHEAAKELALRSRGTPRIANRLLKRVRDYAQINMLGPCHKGYHTLDTDTESTVRNCSILTKIKVEFIFCRIHTKVIHFSNKSIVVFFTYRITDDFTVAFRCQQVYTENTVWISRN